jgi:hypothetical protein
LIEVNEQMVVAIERLRDNTDAVIAVTNHNPPRFKERYPVQYAALRQVAKDMRTFGYEEFKRTAYRIDRILTELDEADRLSRDKRAEDRQCRRQRELLLQAYTHLADAYDAVMDQLTEKGVRVREL